MRTYFDCVLLLATCAGTGLLRSSLPAESGGDSDRTFRDHLEVGGHVFIADGPIRHPAVVWEERTYVGSDDGFLYCLDRDGRLVWKFRGGPSARKVIGAGRLISAWNVSGGPVVHDGKVYFAAGMWPAMGVFVYALNARDGTVVWKNDRTTALWQSESITEGKGKPEFEPSFISVSPNGACRIEDGRLAVPCGRARPAYFDLRTGELLSFNQGGNRPWVQKHVGELWHPDYDAIAERTQGCSPRDAEAEAVLEATGVREGYCLVLGGGNGSFIKGLVAHTKLRLVVIDPNAAKVTALRRGLLAKGVYGTRCSAHQGDPNSFGLPPYFAGLIVVRDERAVGGRLSENVFSTLRPYGGTLCLPQSLGGLLGDPAIANTRQERSGQFALLRRSGALPGADDWSHEHANAANTRASADDLVRSPFGVLWFGGPSSAPRYHYENHRLFALPQVCAGRLLIEGPRLLSCFDVYTGRKLWEWRPPKTDREIWDLDSHMMNKQFVQWAFEPMAGRFASADDAVYLVSDRALHAIDAATGGPLQGFSFAQREDWGSVKVSGSMLYVPSATRVLALDRHTGEVRWEYSSSGGTLAVGGEEVFCLGYPHPEWPDRFENANASLKSRHVKGFAEFLDFTKLKRRGREGAVSASTLVALARDTGKLLWKQDVPSAPRLVYCQRQNFVVAVPYHGRAYGYDCESGESVWRGRMDKLTVFRDDLIVQSSIKVFIMRPLPVASEPKLTDPLTGRSKPFPERPVQLTKTGNGCGPAIVSKHLMTFRSGNAAYLDISGDPGIRSGVINLGGFRSSCHPSLIPANGVLVAPNAVAGGCRCRYPISMSAAFVHLPDLEKWGSYGSPDVQGPIRRIGVNFGAPGDRMAANGTLWLDYPSVGGPSPDVAVRTEPEQPEWFRYHSSRVAAGQGLPWVQASGAKGMRSAAITLNREEAAQYVVRVYYARPAKGGFGNLEGAVERMKLKGAKELTIELDPDRFVCGIEAIETGLVVQP